MREGRDLEFKQDISRSFLKTVSAFANYGTGKIVFGVDDDGNVVGIGDVNEACLRIENMINDSIDPVPRYELEPNEGRKTVALIVYEGTFKPYLFKGKAYRRGDSSTVETDRLEYSRLVLEGRNLTFDQLPSQMQKLGFDELEEAFRTILGVKELGGDTMRTLGLMTSDSTYTNAGALLSDENPFKGIGFIRFGTTINEIHFRSDLDNKPITLQLEEAMLIYDQTYCREIIGGASRNLVELVPREAFRESVANALVHRAWDLDSRITVSMFSDRVEIVSPGGLPPGLDEKDYLKGGVSVPRNPILMNVFFRLRYIEQFGTGVVRIKEAYSGTDKAPLFEIRPNSIKVALPVLGKGCPISPDEKAVYDSLKRGLLLSRSDLSRATGFSKDKAIRLINSLEAKGLLTKTGSGRATRYKRV